jgi:hypothetical protein
MMGLSAFDRHQSLIKNAIKYYRAQLPPEQQTVKTDYDVLKDQYRSTPSVAASEVLQPYKKYFGMMTKWIQDLVASLLPTSCDESSDEHPMHRKAERRIFQSCLHMPYLVMFDALHDLPCCSMSYIVSRIRRPTCMHICH